MDQIYLKLMILLKTIDKITENIYLIPQKHGSFINGSSNISIKKAVNHQNLDGTTLQVMLI